MDLESFLEPIWIPEYEEYIYFFNQIFFIGI